MSLPSGCHKLLPQRQLHPPPGTAPPQRRDPSGTPRQEPHGHPPRTRERGPSPAHPRPPPTARTRGRRAPALTAASGPPRTCRAAPLPPALTEQQQPVRLLVLPLLCLQRLVDALAPLLVRPLLGHQVLPQAVPHLRVPVLPRRRGGRDVHLTAAAVGRGGVRGGQAGAQAVAQPHGAGAARPTAPRTCSPPGRAERGGGARRPLKASPVRRGSERGVPSRPSLGRSPRLGRREAATRDADMFTVFSGKRPPPQPLACAGERGERPPHPPPSAACPR